MLRSFHKARTPFLNYAPFSLPDGHITNLLQQQTDLNILVIRIPDHILIRELYGDEICDEIEATLRGALSDTAELKDILASEKTKPVLTPLGQGEYLFVWPLLAQDTGFAELAFTIKLHLQQHLRNALIRLTGYEPQVSVGCSRYEGTSVNCTQTFMTRVRESRMLARKELDLDGLRTTREFKNIIQSRAIDTCYQPIVRFPNGHIFGWEALSRGPADSPYVSPAMLFNMAEEMGMLFALERVCRENAVQKAGPMEKGQKLFININPRTLNDPEFTPGSTMRIVKAAGLEPENIVLEITERHPIRDFSLFCKTLAHYRSQGFKIAIDDAGTGYSGLSSIAELKPDFIKIDMSLIRNIDKDPVRRALLETFVSFAGKIGSEVIAEGIETREEAATLIELGTHHGQGFFLGKPVYPKEREHIRIEDLQPEVVTKHIGGIGCAIPVGTLALATTEVEAEQLVCDARKLFETPSPPSSIVVSQRGRPTGLIMEYHLNRQLSSQYGIALYFNRPVSSVMDGAPIIVDEHMPVEEVARKAMSRSRLQAYDDVIVTSKGTLLGIVSVQALLNALAKVQVELAKGTSPLTALPGNVALENEMESRIAGNQPFSLIYADLDNFKAYNDSYGFKSGDKIILLLSRILTWATKRHGNSTDFVAHIGGDDFVCVISQEHAERIAISVTRCFKRLVRTCYCLEDLQKGWINARGRDGVERQFPLVSVSLAVLDCLGNSTLQEIGERAAQMKHFAKSICGNVYVVDRRGPVGGQYQDASAEPVCYSPGMTELPEKISSH